MTDPKQSAFLAEYKALCERHGLLLYPSMYDSLQVWPLEGNDPFERIDGEDAANARGWKQYRQAFSEFLAAHDRGPRFELRTGSGDVAATFPDFSQAFPDKR